MRASHIALGLFVAAPAMAAEDVTAPSGQTVSLHEVLAEEQPYSDEVFLVLRVLAPELARVDAEAAQGDLDWICEQFAPQALEQMSAPPAEVVVQMMEEIVPRGQSAAGIAQLFAGYDLREGACVPTVF